MRYVEYEQRDSIVIVRMNRPERGNALGSDMVTDLLEAHARFRDDATSRVAILTGVANFFCAGMDLKQVVATGSPFIDPRSADIFNPDDMPKPIVAAINGWAVGSGMSLGVETCDLVIMAEEAKLAMWELRSGAPARWEYRVTHAMTPAETAEVAFGYEITSRRALQMGLVNRVVPRAQLMDAALEMAEHLVSLPPLAVLAANEMLRKATPTVSSELQEYARKLVNPLIMSRDGMEGIQAFVEKRKPVFEEP